MQALLMRIDTKPSKFGGIFYYLFWKGEDQKSYRTAVYPQYRNYNRWRDIIDNRKIKRWYKNLAKRGKIIDADSQPEEVKDGPGNG